MNERIKLYLDFDGVILDTMNELDSMITDLDIIDNEDLLREFYINVDWDKLLNYTKEINDSINNIKKLIDSNLYDIEILTHVNSEKEGNAKINYLSKVLPGVNVIITPKIIEKSDMVNPLNAILVDDYSKNLLSWKEKGGIAIKFSNKLDERFITINNLYKLFEFQELFKVEIKVKKRLLRNFI